MEPIPALREDDYDSYDPQGRVLSAPPTKRGGAPNQSGSARLIYILYSLTLDFFLHKSSHPLTLRRHLARVDSDYHFEIYFLFWEEIEKIQILDFKSSKRSLALAPNVLLFCFGHPEVSFATSRAFGELAVRNPTHLRISLMDSENYQKTCDRRYAYVLTVLKVGPKSLRRTDPGVEAGL